MNHANILFMINSLLPASPKDGKKSALSELSTAELGSLALALSDIVKTDVTAEQIASSPNAEALATWLVKTYPSLSGVNIVEATQGQRGLWWLDSTLKQPESYNVPVLVTIESCLDAAIMQSAISSLAMKTPLLRTRFVTAQDTLFQLVEDEEKVAFSHRLLSPTEQPETIVRTLATTRLSLSQGPLTLITMLTQPSGKTWLACCFHHILVDAPSVRLLLHDLFRLYDTLANNKTPTVTNDAASYEDFVAWQRTLSLAPDVVTMRDYWKTCLTPLPPLMDLPVDFPRKEELSSQADYSHLTLSVEETADVHRQAMQLGLTPFMYLTLCWQYFLYRITGQNDITVGIPFTLRDQEAFEKTPGYMVNTLPLRANLSPSLTVKSLAAQVRSRFIEAHTNKHVPFSEIVASCDKNRRQDNPIFQTLLVMPDLQSTLFADLPFKITLDDYFCQAAKYDLTLFVEPHDAWKLVIEYNTALFHSTTIAYWLTLFRQLLLSMGKQQESSLASLPLMNAEQQSDVVQRSTRALPDTPASCVIAAFTEQARYYPAHTALLSQDGAWSYQWLDHRSDQIAKQLHDSYMIQAGKRVAILVERNAEAIAALIGTLKTGACYVPIDPQYPAERVAYMLEDAHVDCIVTTTSLSHGVPLPIPMLPIDIIDANDRVMWHSPVRDPESEFYIIYTSGSTGKPKGVRLRNKTLSNLIQWQQSISACGAGDRTLHYMSLSFDVSVQEIFGTLCNGGTLYVSSEEERKDLHHLQQVIQKNHIQRLYFPYVALQQFAHLCMMNHARFPDLKEVYSTGEQLVLTADIKHFFSSPIRLFNLYGPSESHVCSAWQLPANTSDWGDAASIGEPLPGFSLLTLDEDRHPVPIGVAGELWIVSDFLSPGYHNKAQETQQRFVTSHWPNALSQQAYKSGDLVKLERTGTFSYLGRIDNQLKIRGFRIEPSEVEAVINAIEGVQVSAVIGKARTQGDKQLVAFIAGSHPDNKPQVLQQIRQHLPEYMVPGELVFLSALPTTPSGKIDRKALQHIKLAPSAHTPAQTENLSATEQQVKTLWQTMLPDSDLSSQDDFFAVGGHSLLATQLVYLLRQHFQIDFPLKMLFNHPTIAEMSVYINACADAKHPQNHEPDSEFIDEGNHTCILNDFRSIPDAEGDESLLTGATGFLGIYLLRALLRHSSRRVSCLVRAQTTQQGAARLYENARQYGIADEIDFSRVQIYTGDLTKPQFGLNDAQYLDLSSRVSDVFHAAAQINFVLSYASVKDTNVNGTVNILRFCSHQTRKKLHYMSTTAVFSPDYPIQPITEDMQPGFPDTLGMGYTQSKWVAERYVAQAREQGLNVNLFRIGRIGGDSRTGACQSSDFLWRQIQSVIQMEIAPEAHTLTTDLLPVNFVSQAVVELAQTDRLLSSTYHLFHPTGTDFTPVYQAIRQCGYTFDITSSANWLTQLEAYVKAGEDVALGSAIHLFKEAALNIGEQVYHNYMTQEKLAERGLFFPAITCESFANMINYFHKKGILAPAKNDIHQLCI
ncbi:amino acid adenylation domain-containing protein [Dickeya dadantii]|uniref:non-ribosomal peptide synthetase family protein n=1 Tax=Dickeya dadantii TaxID=204038 RepID=UPI001CF49FE5|nr:non-ribosomal peptide synthetase [Dickeya dadantii]MCA7014962.1 amino acid adenylation domain-containing protein [Dickeya dadantii]